jgi:hypothetical protein
MTRDSVCMGDDAEAPHEAEWEVDDEATVEYLLGLTARRCPGMPGNCWVAYFGYSRAVGEPVALLAHGWPWPRVLPVWDTPRRPSVRSGTVEIFWAYRSRAEPEALWRQMGSSPVTNR